MPKKVKVQQIQPDVDGPVFGQTSNPADFMKSQIYSHNHTEINARDYIVGGCNQRAVAGFDYALPGGMQFRIVAPGHIVDVDGKSYELIGVASVDTVLADSDDDLPRTDLVVARRETDADAVLELRPFVRLRTQAELDASVAPYPPQQFNQPTETHNRATIVVKTGVPGSPSVPPTIEEDEDALYYIVVPAASSSIEKNNVRDLRHKVASNCELQDMLDRLRKEIHTTPPLKHGHDADEVRIAPGSPGSKFGKTEQDAWDNLALMIQPPDSSAGGPALRPEILRPDLVPYHLQSGKLSSSGDVLAGVPVVRIPYPREVAFSRGIFPIEPNAFVDQSLNPRIFNDDPDSNTNTITLDRPVTLNDVIVTETTGGGVWELQNVALPFPISTYPSGHRTAARDGRYIEIFGLGGGSSWHTFDTVSKTIQPRVFSGDVPTQAIFFAATCGNGKILIGCNTTVTGVWFVLNAGTGECTSLDGVANQPPSGAGLMGDLIETNVIFLGGFASDWNWWVFHVDTNQFEVLHPTGEAPDAFFHIDLCFYKQGQAVIFQSGTPGGGPNRTTIFDYATRSFIRLNIAQPYNITAGVTNIDRLRLANINGRPQLVGDVIGHVWELTPGATPNWSSFETQLPDRWDAAISSLIANGFPRGSGYFMGGQKPFQATVFSDIWAFKSGGVIATVCDGLPAVTLAPDTRAATLRLPDYQINFPEAGLVGRVLITLRGANIQGRVRVLESFDNGAHLEEIPINNNTVVINSVANPNRQLFLMLSGTENVKPCVAFTHEVFEKAGGIGFSMVYVIFDCPNGTTYLYMDDRGRITVEPDEAQTNTSKAILARITKDGVDDPITFDFINKPRIERKYEGGPKSGGVDPTVAFDFAVLPDFIQCWKIDATGVAKLLQDCAVVFNEDITVNGLADGESFRVHLAG